MGRIDLDDVAEHEPVKEHAQSGEVLLDRGRGEFALQILEEGGDMERLHLGELGDAVSLAPCRKAPRRVKVRLAGVVVVDLGGEEFKDAAGSLRRRGEEPAGTLAGAGAGTSSAVMFSPLEAARS